LNCRVKCGSYTVNKEKQKKQQKKTSAISAVDYYKCSDVSLPCMPYFEVSFNLQADFVTGKKSQDVLALSALQA